MNKIILIVGLAALLPTLVLAQDTEGIAAERLGKEDIVWTVVKTPAEVAADPTPWANGYFEEVDHPSGQKLKVIKLPWQFSKTPPTIRRAAPEMGQDTEDVLTSLLGYSWEDITAFKEKGAIL